MCRSNKYAGFNITMMERSGFFRPLRLFAARAAVLGACIMWVMLWFAARLHFGAAVLLDRKPKLCLNHYLHAVLQLEVQPEYALLS